MIVHVRYRPIRKFVFNSKLSQFCLGFSIHMAYSNHPCNFYLSHIPPLHFQSLLKMYSHEKELSIKQDCFQLSFGHSHYNEDAEMRV